jgi:hypothetical protein
MTPNNGTVELAALWSARASIKNPAMDMFGAVILKVRWIAMHGQFLRLTLVCHRHIIHMSSSSMGGRFAK